MVDHLPSSARASPSWRCGQPADHLRFGGKRQKLENHATNGRPLTFTGYVNSRWRGDIARGSGMLVLVAITTANEGHPMNNNNNNN
jgi:hypothetical protein